MLRAVGNPVVVNPDAELLRLARAENWRVMRFEQLGRRLAFAAVTVIAAALGLIGSTRRRRATPPQRARTLRRS